MNIVLYWRNYQLIIRIQCSVLNERTFPRSGVSFKFNIIVSCMMYNCINIHEFIFSIVFRLLSEHIKCNELQVRLIYTLNETSQERELLQFCWLKVYEDIFRTSLYTWLPPYTITLTNLYHVYYYFIFFAQIIHFFEQHGNAQRNIIRIWSNEYSFLGWHKLFATLNILFLSQRLLYFCSGDFVLIRVAKFIHMMDNCRLPRIRSIEGSRWDV